MANPICPNCNPQYPATPDNAVYHQGTEYPEFGIKNGMPWSEVLDILIRMMPAQSLSDAAMVSATDVSMDNPPEFMVSEYSGCWEKASDRKGSYQLTEQAGVLVFTYDFTDAVSSIRSSLTSPAFRSDFCVEVRTFFTKSLMASFSSFATKSETACPRPRSGRTLRQLEAKRR